MDGRGKLGGVHMERDNQAGGVGLFKTLNS